MIDYIVVLIYLLFVLWLGFYKGRNIKNMREFSVADRKYSLVVMVATVTATFVGGGSTLGIMSSVFSTGLIYALVSMGNPLSHLLVGQFLVNRIGEFSDCISVGDLMRKAYGKKAQIISGICGALHGAAAVGCQVNAIGFIVHYFFNVPVWVGVVLGAGAVIVYSSFGGIKAVTATDLLQFAVLIIAIPMVCNIGLNIVGGYQELFAKIPQHLYKMPNTPSSIINYVFIFLALAIPFVDAPATQRLLMAKDVSQIKSTMRISAAVEAPFFVVVCLLGLIAAAISPDSNPNVAFPHLVNTILPVGLRGLAIAGLLSVVMSTADSYLNAAAICVVHDTIKPLSSVRFKDKTELLLAKLVTFILGFMACIVAVSFDNTMSIMLFCLNFWGPIIVLPLYAVLLGLNASARSFYTGASCGVVAFLLWYFLVESHLGIESLIPSMLANAAGFFMNHLLEKIKKREIVFSS